MRTTLIRGIVACAVLLTIGGAPAFAQSIIKGKVLDAAGKPVEGATVNFESEGTNRKAQTKSDRKGEFLQVGLASGAWKVTASKDGVGQATLPANVSQGRPQELTLRLGAGGGAAAGAEAKEAAELRAAAQSAVAALNAGNHDLAITQFNDLIAKAPTCAECYANIGAAQAAKKDYDAAEAAYKRAVELKPDFGDAYTGLANVYNTQRKFDLAAEASANATKYTATAGGGAGAEAAYNQGVILFNGGKFAEAKAQFDAAVKADPTYAPAFYQLGMASLNTGDIPGAVAALESYLKVAPDGPKAAEVKASLPALQGMLKQ